MIAFSSEKIKEQWNRAPVALRLCIEALQAAFAGPVLVFRIDGHTRFEQGVHSTGLAGDVQLAGASEADYLAACRRVNEKFVVKGPGKQVCTLMMDPANLPSGKRLDTPHVHVQITLDWKCEPRRFLRDHEFIQSQS